MRWVQQTWQHVQPSSRWLQAVVHRICVFSKMSERSNLKDCKRKNPLSLLSLLTTGRLSVETSATVPYSQLGSNCCCSWLAAFSAFMFCPVAHSWILCIFYWPYCICGVYIFNFLSLGGLFCIRLFTSAGYNLQAVSSLVLLQRAAYNQRCLQETGK